VREQLLETLEKDIDYITIKSLIDKSDGGSRSHIVADDRGQSHEINAID
jgi:hypothetical protein